ncbi:uncharacterized protein [Ptychodera flava]|uniref:uncharacterized protein n=1 Tax=Ptychodera flava TaxID=63121 RepID=UPI00396A6F27
MNFDTSTRASFINVLDRGRLKDNDVLKILEACHDTLTNQRFLGWICANGTKDHVQHFVNTGVDVSMHDYMGRTVLHEAAQKGDHEMVQYLLENTQAETNLVDWRGSTPLHCACEKGRDDIAHFLLERENVLASVRDINGRTPLLTALHNKKTSLALGLVKRFGNRLDLSCADKLGFTALHFTYLFKGDDARKFANSINELNGDNKEMAVRYEVQHNYKTVNELWNYHLDTEICPLTKLSKRLRNRWHLAMSNMESDRAKKSDTPSPLCLAVISGNIDAVLSLADDMKSMSHRSPLEIAVMHDKRIILDALLDKYKALGIDLPSLSDVCQYELQNIQNQRGQYDGIHPRDGPGLYRACKAGNKAAVQDLLKFGADVTARFNGKTCLDVCIDEDREAIALELLEHVITKTKTSDVVGNKGICHLILRAAGRDQWKLVERMIELDDFMQSDINTKLVSDSCNQTIIHHMARAGQLKMLQRILNKDIVDALNQVGKYHRTPLWFAIANEHWEVAKLLFLYDLNPLSGDASMDMFFHRLMRMNNPTFDSVLKGGCVVSDTQPCSEYIGRRRISKAYMAIFGSELVADTIYYDRCERKTNYWSVKEAKSSANNLKSGENECKKQVRSDNAPAHINSKYTLRRPKTEKEEKVYQEAKLLFALASNAATNSKSILHLAASRSQLEYARAILSFRPDLVDIPDIEGRTPLFYAALAGNKEMVCLILEKGACQIHASTILTVLLAYYINCKELSHTEIYYQGGIKYRTTDSANDDGDARSVQNDDQGIDDMQIKVYDEIDWLKLKANSVTYLFNETVSLLTWRKRQILTDSASVKKNKLYDVLAILLKNDPRCITDSKSAPSVALVLCALHDAKVLTLFVNGGFDLCRIIQELIFPKLLFITHTEEGQWETKETIYVDSITAEMLIISTVSNASDCLDDAFECLLVLLSKINAISKPTIAKLAVEASAKGKWALLEKILKCATFQELMMAEKLVQDRDGRTVIHYLAKEGQLGYLDEILKEDSYEETLAFDTVDQSLRTPLWYAVAFKHWDVAKKLILLGSCPLKCKTDIHSLMFRFRKFDREGKYKEGLDYFTVGKHPAPLGKYRRGQARPKDQMQELLEHKSKLVKSKTGRKISESARKEKYGSLGVYEAIFHQTDIFTTLVSKGSKLQPEVKKGTDAKTKRLTDKPRSDKEEGFFHRSHKIAQPSKIDVQAMKEVQQLYNLAVCAGNNGAKLLHIAAAAGDVELSKEIIKYRKSFVNCLDSSGMTALFYAVRSGYEETVRCLLENGANARIGLSPLLVSATMWYLTENGSNTTRGQNVLNAWPSKMVSGHMKGLVTFQRFMLDFKESKRNWRLTTKLLLSEVKGLVSEQEVLTLALSILREEGTIADFLSSGFDINTSLSNKSMHSGKDSDTDTLMSPEDVIYVTSSMKMPQSSIARCLDFLLRSGDNETLQRTLLSCMRHSLWDVIYTLIDMFNLQLDNVAAVSLLVKCAEENQVDLVKRLAERLDVSGGVDVGHNHLLVVALHTACKKGHVEMVELLLQTNQIGSFTKISLAEDKPQSLWDTNLPYDNTCQWYVKQQWPRHLELQLDGESKVLKNKQYRSHWTAFHWACHSGKLDVLKALETIAGGIEKAKGVMSEHFNPIELLYVSTLAGHASVFSYLCDDWNLDPSVRLNVSHLWEESHKFKLNFDPSPTSLEIAAVHGHHKIVMLLLQKAEQLGSGFELIKYPADLGPITLYHVASFYGWKDVIDILDQLGLPERSRQDGCGLTPAAYALSTGRRKLYEQLCSTELDENGVFDDHHGKISEITEENTICSFGWLRNHLISNKNNPTTALTQPTDAKQRDPQERAPYKFHYAGYTNDALKCMVTASALDMPHVWQNGDGYIRECFTDMLASAAFCGYANLLDLFLAGKEEVQRKEILSSRRTFDSWIGYMNDNRKECVQKLIDYGAPVSEYTLDFAIRSSSNDGVITLLRNSLGSEGIRKSDAKLGACAVGRNKLLTELTEEVPSFDDHIEGHSDKIDPTCFHCLRIRSVRWFDKFVKRVDVAKNDMLIIKSSSTPRLADRLSLPPEQLKEYQWILGHGNEMADFKKTMLGTIFYNTSDDLSDMGLNQESICHLLNACYMKNTKNKIGEARVPNAAIVALDKAVQLSPENFRSDLVKLFIEFHEDMGEKQLLHVAVTLHLQDLTQTMMSLCIGDTEYKGQAIVDVVKAFNYTAPLFRLETDITLDKEVIKGTLIGSVSKIPRKM